MLKIGQNQFASRLFLGTAGYPSLQILRDAILQSKIEIITVSLRRQLSDQKNHYFWELLQSLPCRLLPNTAGCFSAKEAITTAEMARELFNTHWIKLEVIGDDYTLQPNPFELVKAADALVKKGFEVFPYCTEDLVLCQRLVDCGCQILMPWAAPIGSGRGVMNPYALRLLRERFSDITLIVDAGIGRPSHATEVLEMGFDAVLVNSAVALACDPIQMAMAFAQSVVAGRFAYLSGMMPMREMAVASTPIIGQPFWNKEPS